MTGRSAPGKREIARFTYANENLILYTGFYPHDKRRVSVFIEDESGLPYAVVSVLLNEPVYQVLLGEELAPCEMACNEFAVQTWNLRDDFIQALLSLPGHPVEQTTKLTSAGFVPEVPVWRLKA